MLRPFGRRTDKVRMWPSIKAGVETIIRAIMERSLAKAEGSSPRARAASTIAAHSLGEYRTLFGSRLSAWARGLRSGCGIAVPPPLAAGFLAVEHLGDATPHDARGPLPREHA